MAADRYVVIGNPIAHSKSPDIHARFAAQTGQDMVYDRLLAPLDGFANTVKAFIAEGGRGANVTLPFKLEAFALATRLSERGRAAGAINTLKFEGDEIYGDNTDGVGLVADIERNAGVALRGKRILLLGAGGAARGAILPLLHSKPSELMIANRTVAKALDLAWEFQSQGPVTASDFAELDGKFDVIINATAASIADEMPPVAASLFGKGALAYDMMYAKEPTVFMRFAAEQGSTARDGLGMLVEQAAEAFYVWRGVRPATADVYAALRA
jgi:shikimate dehydrogenase